MNLMTWTGKQANILQKRPPSRYANLLNAAETERSNVKAAPITSRAPGKFILCGEHTVVYGARAIAIPLFARTLELTLTPTAERTTKVFTGGKDLSGNLAPVVQKGFGVLGVPERPVQVHIQSNIVLGAGLGSSAAFCVSLIQAIAELGGRTFSNGQIAESARELETFFHGKPSGLDTTVVSYRAPILFATGRTAEIVRLSPDEESRRWPFVLIDSRMRSSTKAMVRISAPYFQSAAGKRCIDRADGLTGELLEAMQQGDLGAAADLVNESSSLLAEAGVVPDTLAKLLERVRELGCIAAKPTGAGGGGFVLALLDPSKIKPLRSSLHKCFGAEHIVEVLV